MKNLILSTLLIIIFFSPDQTKAQIIRTIAGIDTANYSGDGGHANAAALNHPDVVKFDHSGNMYIADEHTHVIRKINASGIITTIAGTGVAGYSGDGGPATNAALSRPVDIVFDASGNMFIAEYGNCVIRKIKPNGIITTIAGTGANGNTGDNGPATAAQLHNPIGLVFDKKKNLYFSSNGDWIIRKIDTAGIISVFAGNNMSGNTGDNGPATSARIGLTGYLAFGDSGALYIPDYANHVIRKVDTLGIIRKVAGTGSMGSSGDGGPATAAAINSPYAILFDTGRNMYISDAFNYLIRKIDTFGVITTIAGTGMNGFSGDGGPATAAQFDADVNCSAIDAAGNLYIADPNNNRIRRIVYNNVGVNEVNSGRCNVSIYPNPAHNTITISTNDKIESVVVVNLIGLEVASPRPSPGCFVPRNDREVLLEISFLPSGVYFVKVNGVYAGRFVKE